MSFLITASKFLGIAMPIAYIYYDVFTVQNVGMFRGKTPRKTST